MQGEIERAIETIGDRKAEIAFFGGSFTGIDRALMIELLELAEGYVRSGRVTGIRLSTRPDYIDGEIIEILKKYTISAVELGIQSTSDKVLSASRRGHTAKQSETACKLLTEANFEIVGQMMIGLPESDSESEMKTANDICRFGAGGARVYPTVVFHKTELCNMAKEGKYEPLSNEEAAHRTAKVLDVFERAGVKVIRVGLCASENLASDEAVYGGANHSAMGELSMNELYFERISAELDGREKTGDKLEIFVSPGSVSKAAGQKKRNICRIREKYGVKEIKILEKKELIGYNIEIEYK